MGTKARAVALALTPAAMTLKLVLLYRDLLADAAQIREAQAATQTGTTTTRARQARVTEPSQAPGTATMATAPPEVGGAPGLPDAAAELPHDAGLPEPPVLEEPARLPDDLPPELLDGLAGRDPRVG
jgi:hypothetical protein